MKIKFHLLLLIFFIGSCTDVLDHQEYLIIKDIYAVHSAGIDGFSMSKKISTDGYRLIVDACLVSASYNKDLDFILIKRVETLSGKDTIYLKYLLKGNQLDTLTTNKFYNLKSKYYFSPEIILLK